MKKTIVVILACILFFGTGVVSGFNIQLKNATTFEISSRGNTLYVGGSGEDNYTRIQDAIENASGGDIVFVYDDSTPYYENVIVDKSITLIGENRDTTIINGSGVGNVIFISVNWVNISGFTIRNGEYDGITISSNYNNITNNTITSNIHNGIGLYEYSNDNYITNNIISDNLWGIYLTFSSNNTITGNMFPSNGNAGIRITDSSNNNNISHNIFLIQMFAHGAIELLSSSFNVIKYNNFIGTGVKATFVYHLPEDNLCNCWNENYWNRPRLLPKPIFGIMVIGSLLLPWLQFDWHPAKEPYDI